MELLRSLDEPRPVSRQWWTYYVAGMSTFALAFGVFVALSGDSVVGLPLVATAHAVAMGLIYGLLSFLFFTQARGERQLGYLILGFTFGFAGLIWAWFPYFFPNGLSYHVPAAPVVGDENSGAMLYAINRWSVLIGVVVGGYVISRVNMLARRSRPRVTVAVLLMIALSMTILAWAALGAPGGPNMVTGDELPSRITVVLAVSAMVFGALGVVLLVRACRSGSLIARWLLTVAILQWIEAAASPFAPRYTANWLAVRWMSLIGILVLLFVLLWQLARIQRSTARAADLDELTGALSRSAFVRVVDEHVSTPNRAGSGIVWVDLDQFRVVNSTAGTDAGDAFLRECVERLRVFVPAPDLIARIGGDEFALLTTAHSPVDLLERSMQIAEAVSRPLDIGEARVITAASVGCAWIDASVDSVEEALRRSFAAMQVAKSSGGDTAHLYSPDVDAHAEDDLRWRHRLAVAIREESFVNVYQPIFDTATGKPVAVEALIRLNDGDRLVSAGEFIRYAESSGQIVGIGRIGLQRLIYDLPQLMQAETATPLRVSFNLSVLQLADPVVIGMLLKPPLHAYASRLIVEVTESFELSASATAHENLLRLVRAGYRTAIDDFGAGFSNFVQLEEIGRHLIKIDRSLIVRAGTREAASLTVLSAAIAVARSLASEVLAEGVETDAEAEIVQELGIPLVQGFRFARPMLLADTLSCLQESMDVHGGTHE